MGELEEFKGDGLNGSLPFLFSERSIMPTKTGVIVAGKFDPVLAGHVDHIRKASKLGDYLIIITHPDDVVARASKKGFCACPLWARLEILHGLVILYASKRRGEVMVNTHDKNGESTEMLREIRRQFPKDKLIFAKGGDRTKDNMPIKEIKICQELDIELVYGIGDLLSSSSEVMEKIGESYPKRV